MSDHVRLPESLRELPEPVTDEHGTVVVNSDGHDIYVRAEFMGGDPRLCRVREVSVTIPVLGVNDDIAEYQTIVSTVFAELRKLAELSSYEDVQNALVTLGADGDRAGAR